MKFNICSGANCGVQAVDIQVRFWARIGTWKTMTFWQGVVQISDSLLFITIYKSEAIIDETCYWYLGLILRSSYVTDIDMSKTNPTSSAEILSD